MKRFCTFCAVLLALSSLLLSAYANGVGNEPPDPATWMPDANLRKAVRTVLRLNGNEPLTQQKLLNLNVLNARRLGIRDLTGLEYATNLRSLSVGGNQISDLTPLAYLTNLTGLYIGNNLISDITPLTNLTNLRRLGMLRNEVTDIGVLAGLVNLRYLRLGGNPITDTSPLGNLSNLSDVDIEIPSLIPDAKLRAAVHAALGIAPNLRITINAMRSLTTLSATRLGIRDLTGLEYATNLTHLYLRHNRISDINPLAHLTNLRRLEMLRNEVTDINVLSGLVNLEYLRLGGNPITDTSPLRNLPKLINVDVHIFSPPQKKNTQPQGESIDPPQDDGQQQDDRQQDDSDQSQQQDDRRQNDNDQSQQQQSTTNPQPVIEEEEEEEEEDNSDPVAACEAEGKEAEWRRLPDGTLTIVCSLLTPRDRCEMEGGTWDENSETCTLPDSSAPFYPKNAFLLDRITLEQLDPATLETQLDIWLAESDGSALYLRSIALLEGVLATRRPDKTHLLPNYPNPFNPETWIPYHLANPSEVQITIYDTRGRAVRHLNLGHQQEGYYTSRSRAAYWDGRNDIGEKVSSGVYFYQFQTDRISLLRKMVILK